uniref:RRM domain-containing protein n=1 Tax=Cynoglossus semilaevis TaxID=244447 RepID=A0A3P8WMN0_CYNSE
MLLKFDEPGNKVFIVQVKGLPWSCLAQDFMEFFFGIRDGLSGIHLTVDRLGRPSGRAFIVSCLSDVSKALEQHHQYLGSRYVEVTKSDAEAILKKALQAAADDSAVVRLRGLPFTCTEDDIVQFFTGDCLRRILHREDVWRSLCPVFLSAGSRKTEFIGNR